MGLSLVFGTMRLTNLAHGDLTILPAYVALMLVGALEFNPFYSIPITMVIMFAFGYLLQTRAAQLRGQTRATSPG